MDSVHFLCSSSSAICGENRIGQGVTRDIEKVTCGDCKAALAVTKLVMPKEKPAEIDPPEVKPEVKVNVPKPEKKI